MSKDKLIDAIGLIKDEYIEEARLAFYTGSGQISRETLFLSDMAKVLSKVKYKLLPFVW